MKHEDYLGELPEFVKRMLTSITGDWIEDQDLIEWLANEAERQIENRYEICLSLLDSLDLIEIAVQRSMVPSKKTAFACKVYMQYFRVLAKLLQKAARTKDSAEIEGMLPFLIMKMRYELNRRKKVIAKCDERELKKILRPILHLL